MKAFCPVYYDDGLLPFWLRYYFSHGVNDFFMLVHKPTEQTMELLKQYPCRVFHNPKPFAGGEWDTVWLEDIVKTFVRHDEWYIIADLDEFHWWSGLDRFQDAFCNFDAVSSFFVDRVAMDGKLHPIVQSESLDQQFPMQAAVTEHLNGGVFKFCSHKIMMVRGFVKLGHGHHVTHSGLVQPAFVGQTHHFKWHGPELIQRLTDRLELVGRRRPGLIEFGKYYAENGRIALAKTPAPFIGI